MEKTHRDRPLDLTRQLEVLVESLEARNDVVALYLYGSHGTAHQTPLSDVDLAIVLDRDRVPSFEGELALRSEILGTLAESDVSITLLQRSDPIFQFEVLRTGRLLLVRDREALADFVEEVLDRHADYVIDHEAMLRDYDAALREEVVAGRDVS